MQQSTIDQIKERIIPLYKRGWCPTCIIIWLLCSSYVRGEQTEESDIDILIEFPEGKSLLDLESFSNDLIRNNLPQWAVSMVSR